MIILFFIFKYIQNYFRNNQNKSELSKNTKKIQEVKQKDNKIQEVEKKDNKIIKNILNEYDNDNEYNNDSENDNTNEKLNLSLNIIDKPPLVVETVASLIEKISNNITSLNNILYILSTNYDQDYYDKNNPVNLYNTINSDMEKLSKYPHDEEEYTNLNYSLLLAKTELDSFN